MPLKKGSSKKMLEYNTKELIKSGRSPKQAVAIAYRQAEEKKKGKKKK